jgi:hypothetical protein
MPLPEFHLDESLEWHISVYTEYNSYLDKEVVTDEDLVEVLKGKGHWSTTGSDDGPEFKALRNQLEADGYIECQRGWWNGDRVVKPFQLNGLKFKKGSQFSSGAALKFHLEFLRKHPEYAE